MVQVSVFGMACLKRSDLDEQGNILGRQGTRILKLGGNR